MTMTDYQNDVAAIREGFEAGKGRTLKLSDAVLDMVITKAGDAFEEMDDEQTLKFLEEAETEAAKVSISDPGISALVDKMDEEFHNEVAADIAAVVRGKVTAVNIYAQMRRIYTLDEMNGFPIPNSDKDTVIGNQRPDKVVTTDQTGKKITIVWTNDFVSAMPEGKAAENTIAEAKKEKDAPGSTSFKGKSKKDLAAIVTAATQERNALRSMVKRAIALHHALVQLDGMPKIGFSWQKPVHSDKMIVIPEQFGTGEHGKRPIKCTTGAKTFWLFPSDDPSEGREFSVTQLINMDFAAAKLAGGTMTNLVETIGKGSDDNGADSDGDGTDMAIDAAQAVFSQAINWFSKKENLANYRRIVADKKNPDRADWIENIGDLYLMLQPEFERVKMAYNAIKATKTDEAEDEAEKKVA